MADAARGSFGGSNGGLGGVPDRINGTLTNESTLTIPAASPLSQTNLEYGQNGFGGVGYGAGGGTIRIVAKSLQFAGRLSAVGLRSMAGCGGGAGGSVYVETTSLNVTQDATIDVSGGEGSQGNGVVGGGGGGGRVMIVVTNMTASAALAQRDLLSVKQDGGVGDAATALRNGGVGSFLFVSQFNTDKVANLYVS